MLIEESGSVWDASPGSAPGRLHQLGGGSPPDSPRRNDGETTIKFRSFSLGDVFAKEIQRFGQFAFHRRNSSGESSMSSSKSIRTCNMS
jgi:hypothetical protein